MDTDRITGSAKSTFGKVEKSVGRAFGDSSTAASGAANQAEGIIQNAAGQVKDAMRSTVDSVSDAGAAAYDQGSDLVGRNPGSSLLMAGLIGFAIGAIITRNSPPPRNSLRKYYDRYSR